MKKFIFQQDERIAAWVRTTVTVEADSLEEAKSKIKAAAQEKGGDYWLDITRLPEGVVEIVTKEEFMGIDEYLPPGESKEDSTRLLMDEHGEEIYNNQTHWACSVDEDDSFDDFHIEESE